ncbi:MAG: hypothetical protein CO113_10520 [Elusimicrobia bacterium CG_4_9_14_3_um_filter_62_55]|nr:MAG: hypothetical protein COR54_20080 [Elusimicrobia bacterium CG22_combo_CG10-13_8_21_14_all_63_91]PJA17060.1 MAG: hypothetical protein COX66_06030 [Elusimicrobia bacterium CG_4_10_14_0_2_um_filter_63_34]PJB25091.1 MAG: hypothetical protein CO113_10520 [Elusimicrobia bacterium CG_4_9_14_3_um_filter_62_55]
MARRKVIALSFLLAAAPLSAQDGVSPKAAEAIRVFDARIVAANAQSGNAAKPLAKKKLRDKDAVRRRILHMKKVDQIVRAALIKHWKDPMPGEDGRIYGERVIGVLNEIDPPHTAELKRILEARRWKWITRTEFGDEVSEAAWLLVQHADRDPAFQKKILGIMEKLPEAEVSKRDAAYLFDRVAVKTNAPQRYATQWDCDGATPVVQGPELDLEAVEKRRAEIGLEPLNKYKKGFVDYCAKRALEKKTP